MSKKITDFTGKVFSSKTEMCDFYGISRNAYDQRINRGWSQEKALTSKTRGSVASKTTVEEERQKRHNYNVKYYAENKKRERARVSEYKKLHRDEIREKDREYREKNRDKIKAYRNTPAMKKYQQEYQKRYQPIYRAKKKAEAELKTGELVMEERKEENMDLLSVWLEVKTFIDVQSKTQDFARQNFEQVIYEMADIKLMRAISNSAFLWQRANNYFSCKQREIIRDSLFDED